MPKPCLILLSLQMLIASITYAGDDEDYSKEIEVLRANIKQEALDDQSERVGRLIDRLLDKDISDSSVRDPNGIIAFQAAFYSRAVVDVRELRYLTERYTEHCYLDALNKDWFFGVIEGRGYVSIPDWWKGRGKFPQFGSMLDRRCPFQLREWKSGDVALQSYEPIELGPVDKTGNVTVYGPAKKWACETQLIFAGSFVYYTDGDADSTYVCIIDKTCAAGTLFKLRGGTILWRRSLWGVCRGGFSVSGGTVDNFCFEAVVENNRIGVFFSNFMGSSLEIFEDNGTSVGKFSSLNWGVVLTKSE